jgi:hypothetical protein
MDPSHGACAGGGRGLAGWAGGRIPRHSDAPGPPADRVHAGAAPAPRPCGRGRSGPGDAWPSRQAPEPPPGQGRGSSSQPELREMALQLSPPLSISGGACPGPLHAVAAVDRRSPPCGT